MKILQNLKNTVIQALNIPVVIHSFFVPKYTQDWIDNKEQQCWEIKCYKNGKYTHTVNMHYFTEKQIERFKNCV